MVVEYKKLLPRTFVVDAVKLKKLTELLEDNLGSVTFFIDCADGRSYKFESVEDLINYENPKSKKILKLGLHVRSADDLRRSLISFNADSGLVPGFYMKLEVKESELFYIKDKIEDAIAGMRPWYNFIARLAIWITFGVILLAITAEVIIIKQSGIIENVDDETKDIIARLIPIGTAWLIGYPVYKMLSTCFPRGFFAIGQGESRYKTLQWTHGFIGSFIIALIFFIARFLIS